MLETGRMSDDLERIGIKGCGRFYTRMGKTSQRLLIEFGIRSMSVEGQHMAHTYRDFVLDENVRVVIRSFFAVLKTFICIMIRDDDKIDFGFIGGFGNLLNAPAAIMGIAGMNVNDPFQIVLF